MTCFLKMLMLGAVVFTAVQFAAAGQHEPPAIPAIANTPSTLPQPPTATTLLLGSVSIQLEETTLDSIVKSVGAGRVERKGDAGDSASWLCYSLPHGLRLWLVSGELGGQDRLITSWHVLRRDGKGDVSCPELPLGLRLADTNLREIWIGASAVQLKASLRSPSALRGGWRIYSYSGRAAKEGFEQLTIFGAHVRSGRVDQLFASQVTTN